MKVSEKRKKVSVAEAVEIFAPLETPAKDMDYWAGSAERAMERNRRTQEVIDKLKAEKIPKTKCLQDCADCPEWKVDEQE